MEQEVYCESAEVTSQMSLQLIRIICTLLPLFHHYNTSLQYCLCLGTPLGHAISSIRAVVIALKNLIKKLIFMMRWIHSYGEIALLYAEDLSIYIRCRNRFQPKRFCQLNDISRSDSYRWFGHSPNDLRRLFIAWRIPPMFCMHSSNVFSGEECFIIFLYHLMKALPFTEMPRHVFGGDPQYMSSMFDLIVDQLYVLFYNKISGTSINQCIPRYLDRC